MNVDFLNSQHNLLINYFMYFRMFLFLTTILWIFSANAGEWWFSFNLYSIYTIRNSCDQPSNIVQQTFDPPNVYLPKTEIHDRDICDYFKKNGIWYIDNLVSIARIIWEYTIFQLKPLKWFIKSMRITSFQSLQ